MKPNPDAVMTRRQALVAAAALTAAACPETTPVTSVAQDVWTDAANDIAQGDGPGTEDAEPEVSTPTDVAAADVAPPQPDASTDASTDVPWLTGGTAAITPTMFRDPFADGAGGASCELTCSQMLGPCFAPSLERRDISGAIPGLPTRLSLRVVDAVTCQPVADVEVEVWACDLEGVYSGQTPSTMCSGSDPDARDENFMRGWQRTDADGRVDFDMVFPGWYPGRAPHLHLQMRRGGDDWLTTQLYVHDELANDVYANQPDYSGRGPHDTSLTKDGIAPKGEAVAPYVVQAEKTPDGALLTWLPMALRASLDDPLCVANAPG